jgi:hypothetical protein
MELAHSMEQNPSWEADRSSASQEISPHFMEPEDSLLHSQLPATCPCPESGRSSPCPHIPLSEDPCVPSGLFPIGPPPQKKTLYKPLLSSICATCPTHLILLDFIT